MNKKNPDSRKKKQMLPVGREGPEGNRGRVMKVSAFDLLRPEHP